VKSEKQNTSYYFYKFMTKDFMLSIFTIILGSRKKNTTRCRGEQLRQHIHMYGRGWWKKWAGAEPPPASLGTL